MFNPPFPTVRVTDQVGWTYNGALYCTQCEPDPYLSSHAERVEAVLRCDVDSGYRGAYEHYWATAHAGFAQDRAAEAYALAHAAEYADRCDNCRELLDS